jgi:spectinomycin phosphotransferase
MREPPTFVRDAEVLAVVSDGWPADVDTVEQLPVGFGAHHWVARRAGEPRWFVTLDRLGHRHTARSLEAAYPARPRWLQAGWSSSSPRWRTGAVGSPRRWPVMR